MYAMLILNSVITGNLIISVSALRRLQHDRRTSMRAALASGTKTNLKVQWRSYLIFCEHFSLAPFPASVDVLSLYAQFLSRTFKTVEAIRNYLSGVRSLHLFQGLECPSSSEFELKLVLDGIKRLNPHCPKRARPITPVILNQIRNHLDLSDPVDATYWCAFVLAFFLFLRKSNLVPVSVDDFNPDKQLRRMDVALGSGALVVTINWSKTIQFGQKVLKLPLFALPGHPLCPVEAYSNMIKLVPGPPSAPAFSLRKSHKRKLRLVPLTYSKFQKKLRFVLDCIGLPSNLFSSHSFRRGGATWAFESNIPGELIKLQGDWASDSYLKYLEFSFKSRAEVFSRMSANLCS